MSDRAHYIPASIKAAAVNLSSKSLLAMQKKNKSYTTYLHSPIERQEEGGSSDEEGDVDRVVSVWWWTSWVTS